jgi:hypothetical protein
MITKRRYMMLLEWIAMNSSRLGQVEQDLGDLDSIRLEAGVALVEREALGNKLDQEILMIYSKNLSSSSQWMINKVVVEAALEVLHLLGKPKAKMLT